MNRLLCQWAGGLLLAILLLQPARAVDVRAIRLWAGPDNPRVVVDLSGSAQHTLLLLHNPERAVVDVSGARLAKSAHSAPRAPSLTTRRDPAAVSTGTAADKSDARPQIR